jgi:hypothetical protein
VAAGDGRSVWIAGVVCRHVIYRYRSGSRIQSDILRTRHKGPVVIGNSAAMLTDFEYAVDSVAESVNETSSIDRSIKYDR